MSSLFQSSSKIKILLDILFQCSCLKLWSQLIPFSSWPFVTQLFTLLLCKALVNALNCSIMIIIKLHNISVTNSSCCEVERTYISGGFVSPSKEEWQVFRNWSLYIKNKYRGFILSYCLFIQLSIFKSLYNNNQSMGWVAKCSRGYVSCH